MSVKKPAECQHDWRPFTKWKAQCVRCMKASPWTDLVTDAEHRGWQQGIGYSVAEVLRAHDEPTIAIDLAGAAGLDYSDFKHAGVDEYDLKTIRKHVSVRSRKTVG